MPMRKKVSLDQPKNKSSSYSGKKKSLGKRTTKILSDTLAKLPPPTDPPDSGLKGSAPILIPLLRKALPQMIAFDVAGVQPLSPPSGLIFSLKSKGGRADRIKKLLRVFTAQEVFEMIWQEEVIGIPIISEQDISMLSSLGENEPR